MAQSVSMADIARELNISRATVSYVLNGRDTEFISESTRSRVLVAARQMGYRPNRAAQALAGQRSNLVELYIHGFYPAFYGRVLQEFEELIGPSPYQLHILHPRRRDDKDWEKDSGGWPIDGVILFDAPLPKPVMADLKERRVPIVAVGLQPRSGVDHVQVDLNPALTAAMRHLAAQGERVAYLSQWPREHGWITRDPRYPAYHAVMQEAGLEEEIIVVPDATGLGTRASTREIVREHITQRGCPRAIFCFNDERAIASLAALRDLGYRVPEDVQLIGCDGIEDTLYHTPPLSTIEYPVEAATRLAWQFLQRRMQEPDLPLQNATLTARLLLRESSPE